VRRHASGPVRLQGMLKVNEKKIYVVDGHRTDHTRRAGTALVSAIKCQKAQVSVFAHF